MKKPPGSVESVGFRWSELLFAAVAEHQLGILALGDEVLWSEVCQILIIGTKRT